MPIINDVEVEGCEFQKECIEYKDISYLKDMPICAVFSMSVACHDKVNKCKYYSLYKQLQRVKAEIAELKNQLMILDEEAITVQITTEEFEEFKNLKNENAKLKEENETLKSQLDFEVQKKEVIEAENEKLNKTLQKIKEIVNTCLEFKTCEKCKFYKVCNRDLEGCILILIKKVEERCQ